MRGRERNQVAKILTYFHPTIDPQPTQNMSTTVCIPVIIIRSSCSPTLTFTLHPSTISLDLCQECTTMKGCTSEYYNYCYIFLSA